MTKKFFLRSVCLLSLALPLYNCNSEGYGLDGDSFSLNTATFFPFRDQGNWWKYSDSSGHQLSDSISQVVVDDSNTYFEVVFAEKGKDTTDDWLRRSSLGTEYSTSLIGPYSILLPTAFTARHGSFLSATGDNVSYVYSDSMLIKDKYRKKVMALTFPLRNIHGFNEIDFADTLGIVRLVDNSGRFPVIYTLDSAKLDGVSFK